MLYRNRASYEAYALPIPITLLFFNDTATTEIYTLSLHDALPISPLPSASSATSPATSTPTSDRRRSGKRRLRRSEEHTSELTSRQYLVCRLLLAKKNTTAITNSS